MAPPASLQGPTHVRGLAWRFLDTAGRRLATGAEWGSILDEARAPDPHRADPFEPLPAEAFHRTLRAVEARFGPAGLRQLGHGAAEAWGHTYRSLAQRARGDPARLIEVYATEAHPWMFAEAAGTGNVDVGSVAMVVRLAGALPDAFVEGTLEGLAALAGAPGARAARRGDGFAVSWERAAPPPSRSRVLARALRLPMLVASLLPALLGAALAARDGLLALPFLALTLLGVAALHLASNAANDYFDHRSRADEANVTPTRFSGGSRVIQRGLLTARAVRFLALALYAAGAALGIALAALLPAARGEILLLGAAGVLLGVLYTAPPVSLASRGLGELAVGLGFGPLVTAGTYLVQRAATLGQGGVPLEAWVLGVPVGALTAAVLMVNEFPDRPWDAQAGKRTLVVRLRGARALWGLGALLGVAYGSIALAAAWLRSWPLLLALLTMPLAAAAFARVRRDHAHPFRLARASAAALAVHVATSLLLGAGLLLPQALGGG